MCAAGFLFLKEKLLFAEKDLIPAVAAVDHLLLGVSDLHRGIEWVEERTGVKAVIGGVHPGAGTRNALLSLGSKRYLEIVAPDPQQTSYNFPVDVRLLTDPKLIAWAAASEEVSEVAKKARQTSYPTSGPYEGSRNKPDGTILRWKLLFIPADFAMNSVDPMPFFIQWAADSIHPSKDSPRGCDLESLEFEHPKADLLIATLKTLGIAATARQAAHARIIAKLKTSRGQVVLS